jgi:hypothetical protein
MVVSGLSSTSRPMSATVTTATVTASLSWIA